LLAFITPQGEKTEREKKRGGIAHLIPPSHVSQKKERKQGGRTLQSSPLVAAGKERGEEEELASAGPTPTPKEGRNQKKKEGENRRGEHAMPAAAEVEQGGGKGTKGREKKKGGEGGRWLSPSE